MLERPQNNVATQTEEVASLFGINQILLNPIEKFGSNCYILSDYC